MSFIYFYFYAGFFVVLCYCCFLLVCVFFCIIAILTGVKWYLIAALSIVGHKNGICSVSLEWSQQ